jgi:hypothetical protein
VVVEVVVVDVAAPGGEVVPSASVDAAPTAALTTARQSRVSSLAIT